ncbi:MAG: adenylate/guanylate cyclase domain-containing protein [Gemmatimonadota bacterium]|nr:adenylate/guanylate cyclase domain-containing protein [Gemmatimonadota bacterium]
MTVRHRLAAIWFADIVDYSRLIAADQGNALEIVREFQSAVSEAVERYGGRVVKFLGDGALAEFRSVHGAIAAADALCAAFDERVEARGLECRRLRIGVHVGEIVHTEDGDVYGDGVNVAQRIQSEAEPGEILVSGEASRQARQHAEIDIESLGRRELKGVGEIDLHRVRLAAPIEPEEERGSSSPGGVRGIVEELQRRHVFRVAVLYAVVAWVAIQVAAATFDPLGLPEWAHTLVVVVAIVGFPVIVALAWAYEWTPQGVRRTAPGRIPESFAARIGRHAVVAVSIVAAVVAGWVIFRAGTDSGVAADDAETEVELDPGRLAVLYFDERPEGPETEALAAGFTESIIDQLNGIDELDVVSRYGVAPFRDAGAAIDSIAASLGAGTIVDGTVERAGDRVRVRVRLVDARDLSDIGAWTEERAMGDLFELQEQVAEEIARNLRTRLGERLRLERGRQATESVEAWELVQRAERLRDQAWEVSQSNPDVAISLLADGDELLARAESLDPGWSEPVLLRAELASRIGRPEAYREGLDHLRKVLTDEPRNARARWLRGVLHDSLASAAADSTEASGHVRQANVDLRFAVGVAPDLARAHISLAELLYHDLWNLPEARQAAERAHREDPFLLEEDHFVWLCEISVQMGDLATAREWCAEGRKRYPDRARLVLDELLILASPGETPDPAAGWELVERMARLEHQEFNLPIARMQVAAILARAGEADSTMAVVDRVRESAMAEVQPYLDYYEAYVRLQLGDRERSLDLLESFLTLAPSYRAIVAREPWFQSFSGDPRFEAIVDDRLPIYCRLLCGPPGEE